MVIAAAGVALRAVRGATTASGSDAASVARAVRELVEALVRVNDLAPAQVLSAIWSATSDITSLYPAAVARELGWQDVPMLCVAEMEVEGSPARCIRVLLHLAMEADAAPRPVYLHGARVLRPDLAGDA